MQLSILLLLFLTKVYSDIYIQTPPGANNRLDEASRDRNNANRVHNSQNNNRGGYNVGKMAYYVGEKVPITWTNQHSSGDYQLKGSEFVIQYMCDELARDGSTTNRIPTNPTQCTNYDCDRDVEYGRHESNKYYMYCKATERNKGLFIGGQNLNGNRRSRRNTRQNPAGTRHGYECEEERDYYPWWGHSPWKDIVIYTNQIERCPAYRRESQNVKARYECRYTDWYWTNILEGYVQGNPGNLPLSKEECLDPSTNMYSDLKFGTGKLYQMRKWVKFEPWGIPEPECKKSKYQRPNHHGIIGRKYWTYVWTVPNEVTAASSQCCVLRLRYNITTNDYPAWESDSSINAGVDYRNNTKYRQGNPNPDNDPAYITLWKNFRLTYDDIKASMENRNPDSQIQKMSRGYVFRNNPRVDPFGHVMNYDGMQGRIQLQLAINTNQFGRTFQDRTHCFQIKRLPKNIRKNAHIQLVTVSGKRGNIVQTFPAHEYYFMPEPATIPRGGYVHFCWTGSNTNPNNNAGQGKAGTDRSNICPLTQPQWDKSMYGNVDSNVAQRNAGSVGDLGNNYPDYVRRPRFGFPLYYNYAPKRDIPKRSRTADGKEMKLEGKHMDEDISEKYPYNDPYNRYYFSEKGKESRMAGLSQQVLNLICTGRRVDLEYSNQELAENNPFGLMDFGNMEELDDMGTTTCLEPKRVLSNGCWNFISTRNNNFSNRSHKGKLCVVDAAVLEVSVSSEGYIHDVDPTTRQAKLIVSPNSVFDDRTLQVSLVTHFNFGKDSTIVEVKGPSDGVFQSTSLKDGANIEVWVAYTAKSLSQPVAYFRKEATGEWKRHSVGTIQQTGPTTYAAIQLNEGGFYTIQNKPNILAYIAYITLVISMGAVLFFIVRAKCQRKN